MTKRINVDSIVGFSADEIIKTAKILSNEADEIYLAKLLVGIIRTAQKRAIYLERLQISTNV